MGQNESFIGRNLRGPLGIDPNSPLGNLSRWNLQDDVIDPSMEGIKNLWGSLSQAPPPVEQPRLMPSHGGPSVAPAAPPAAVAGLKGVGIDGGQPMSNRSYVMDTKDPNKIGRASCRERV